MGDAPAGLPATQSFTRHVGHLLPDNFENLSLFNMGMHMTVMKFSNILRNSCMGCRWKRCLLWSLEL